MTRWLVGAVTTLYVMGGVALAQDAQEKMQSSATGQRSVDDPTFKDTGAPGTPKNGTPEKPGRSTTKGANPPAASSVSPGR